MQKEEGKKESGSFGPAATQRSSATSQVTGRQAGRRRVGYCNSRPPFRVGCGERRDRGEGEGREERMGGHSRVVVCRSVVEDSGGVEWADASASSPLGKGERRERRACEERGPVREGPARRGPVRRGPERAWRGRGEACPQHRNRHCPAAVRTGRGVWGKCGTRAREGGRYTCVGGACLLPRSRVSLQERSDTRKEKSEPNVLGEAKLTTRANKQQRLNVPYLRLPHVCVRETRTPLGATFVVVPLR